MKVTIKKSNDYNKDERQEVLINDEEEWTISSLCECPEDAIIGRSLIDGSDLLRAIRLGWEAGKSGEALEVEEIEEYDE